MTLGLTSGQDKILCGDLMFSGHTVVLTLMFFVIQQYTPKKLALLRYDLGSFFYFDDSLGKEDISFLHGE